MKPLAIWTIVISVLMILSFTISGLFFFNSGMFDFNKGMVTEDNAFILMVQLDTFQNDKFGLNSNNIESIARDDGHCEVDSDCTWFSSHCGDCYLVPINKQFETKYTKQVSAACKGYKGSICDIVLPDVKCKENRCKIIYE